MALNAEGATEADDMGMRDELCTQHLHPPQHFIVASTAGPVAFPQGLLLLGLFPRRSDAWYSPHEIHPASPCQTLR